MENEFEKVMSERTDEELIKIITVERERYNPTAIEAADAEIKKRHINISDFEHIQKKVTAEKGQKEKVDSNIVSSGIRFLHYIIDFIIAYLLILIVFIILGLLITSNLDSPLAGMITLFIAFGTFLAYYALMEIKFQKTIGK